ncbi:MAG: hypothetical protein JWN04_1110 [Myxococcaceae bacterium]|nr:hypothetical protein [Myxococcaceae bacterium]
MFKVWGLSLACTAAAAVGCDYNNDGPPLPDAGAQSTMLDAGPRTSFGDAGGSADGGDGGHDHDAAGSFDASDVGASVVRNESFESALALELGGSVLQDIRHSQQSNYFAFEIPSPGFYELKTSHGDFSPDVVLSLYDGARTLFAQNDDGSLWPGDAVDARLVVHLSTAGHYFVKVDDPSTPADFFRGDGLALRFYRLDLRALELTAQGVTYSHTGITPRVQFARDAQSGYGYTTLVGVMQPATTDMFAIASSNAQAMIGHLLASGTMGNGSTASEGPVRLSNTMTGQVLGDVDGTPAHLQLFPPLGDGSYLLGVGMPATLGANAFYAIDLVVLPDNPREQAELGNAGLAGAEPITFDGSGQRRGLLLSDVQGQDVDYYSFAGSQGETVYASCAGESQGSGVRELHVELRDSADQTLSTAVESATRDLDISAFALPAAGRFYLRLSSQHAASSGIAEPWVRCAVMIVP